MFTLRLLIAYGVFGLYRKKKFLNIILPFDGHFKEGNLSKKKQNMKYKILYYGNN